MPELMKTLPAAPYHFPIFIAIVWRLYYLLSGVNFAIASVSLLWLLIRLHRVLRQPVDRLIEILGIEVPSAPLIELIELSHDSVSLNWYVPEKHSNAKYWVQVNGIHVSDVTTQENAITVVGLQPNTFYSIRVGASTQAKHQAASEPIHIRTNLEPDAESKSITASTPSIVPYKGAYDGLTATTYITPPLERAHSSSFLQQPKRRTSLRKSSPSPFASPPVDRRAPDSAASEAHTKETIKVLTATLNDLRKELDEQIRLDQEEDEANRLEIQELTERRDELRQELKEKEDNSKELKKSVNQLERQNQAAQQKRTTQEKALAIKENERQKLQEDKERWEKERLEFRKNMDMMRNEFKRTQKDFDGSVRELRQQKEPHLEMIRNLEEQIRDTGKQVKELDETRKENSEPSDSPKIPESDTKMFPAPAKDVEERLKTLQEQIIQEQARAHQTKQRLAVTQARWQTLLAQSQAANQSNNNTYDPKAAEFTPSSHFVGPHRETLERRQSMGTYGPPPGFPAPSSAIEARNAFPSSLHTNLEAGLAPNDFDGNGWPRGTPSPADIEKLTGGAMASPGANALLPSDLLGDDETGPMKGHRRSRRSGHESDSVGSRPSSTLPPPGAEYHQALRETYNPLPGLGTLPGLGSTAALPSQNPQSPLAGDSRSPSVTSSPHESHRGSESIFESDRRSVRSTSSSTPAFTRSSRFLNDVFSRQRGKSYTVDEGPSLGSLQPSESRSFPRNADQGETNESITGIASQRRTGAGAFFGGIMSRGTMGRSRLASNSEDVTGTLVAGNASTGRLSSRIVSSGHSSWDAGSNSRPISTYSAEHAFATPWNDSGLGRSNTTNSARHRVHALSSVSSRRGSTAVDPMGSTVDMIEVDEDALPPPEDEDESPSQKLAPIGTKPSKFLSRKEARDRQLNPNARDFRSLFLRERRGDRKKDKSPNRPDTAETDDLGILGTLQTRESHVYSPDNSTEDLSASHASESGPSTPAEASTPTTRESLMRKLTRKSSHLPGLKGRRTAGNNTPQLNADDIDEDATTTLGGGPIARTPSSLTSSPKVSQEKEKDVISKRSSGFSLNSFKRRGKKDKDAPSISETSMTSGTGDEAERSERPSTDD